MDHVGVQRARIDARYREAFGNVRGLTMHEVPEHCTKNHAYFPVLVTPEFGMSRDELYAELRKHQIAARRYFYPLISEFPSYRGLASASAQNLPTATAISRQVLCLPIYPALEAVDQERIIEIVLSCWLRNGHAS
jgi:dTDP-4-amino-4,6-dideoxygalactose transaminase